MTDKSIIAYSSVWSLARRAILAGICSRQYHGLWQCWDKGCWLVQKQEIGDRALAKSMAMMLCAHFLLPRLQQKAWSLYMSCSMMQQPTKRVRRDEMWKRDNRQRQRRHAGVKVLFSYYLGMMLCNNMVCPFWLEGPAKMSTEFVSIRTVVFSKNSLVLR